MCRITYFNKRNQMKIQKLDLESLILKFSKILKKKILKIFYKNSKRPRNFGDICTGRKLAKNREIV
jgi:hypothetical protein